ncbi:hypothetical protein P0D75_06955 [Paraburkholderia sediminicola]|uniref:hypothetical protein n=1 Tax=Paraburkholderia sediminicola TaxID=458836 RepID=UPI0038BD461C
MITEREIRQALNNIIDPCSVAAGCPAGLDDMGLVRHVSLVESAQGVDVEVVIAITEYGCLMGAPFATEAFKTLSATPGIAGVEVKLDDRFDWEPEDMTPGYRARLQQHRAIRPRMIPVYPMPAAPLPTATER